MLSCRSGTCWNKSNPRRLRRVRAQLVAMLAANCCESSWHPWIVVVAARPTDAQLDWDLGNLEARSTPLSSLSCSMPFLSRVFSVMGGPLSHWVALPSRLPLPSVGILGLKQYLNTVPMLWFYLKALVA